MDNLALASKIKQLEGLTTDEQNQLIQLLNQHKKY